VIHVAGTNGKGSVCAYLSSVLTEVGYRVGRYTSPHLIDWNERICLNEQPISTEALEELLLQIKAVIPENCEDSPTQFEVITAAAWLYFAQQQVDIAVMEVGLGGRLDATNVCSHPLVTIITSLSREHWQVLGPTLADIAREKAGILKPGCPAVIGQLPPEAKAVVEQRIKELGCPAVWVKPAVELPPLAPPYQGGEQEDLATPDQGGGQEENLALIKGKLGNSWAVYEGIKYPLPLLGEIQLSNSAIAIATLQILRSQGWQISEEAIASGMAKTYLARTPTMDYLEKSPPTHRWCPQPSCRRCPPRVRRYLKHLTYLGNGHPFHKRSCRYIQGFAANRRSLVPSPSTRPQFRRPRHPSHFSSKPLSRTS
jgi:dihydrofolate synthase/folylpolyglutamate synthase